MRSAPARSASATCSPKWAKSADRIEGASLILPLSISRARGQLGVRRVEDTLNGFLQHSVELSIGLLGGQPFDQRPRKARHHTVISAQPIVGVLLRITTRQRNHPHNLGMANQIEVEV